MRKAHQLASARPCANMLDNQPHESGDLQAGTTGDAATERKIGPAPILSGQEAGPIEADAYDTTPLENCEVSPVLSVSVAVMRGYVPSCEVFVVVKVKFCVPVLVGVTVSEPR